MKPRPFEGPAAPQKAPARPIPANKVDTSPMAFAMQRDDRLVEACHRDIGALIDPRRALMPSTRRRYAQWTPVGVPRELVGAIH